MDAETANATGSPDFVAMRSPAARDANNHADGSVAPPIGSTQSTFTFGSTAALTASSTTHIASSQATMTDISSPVKPTSSSSCCCGASRTSVILTIVLVISTLLIIAGAILPTVVDKVISDKVNDAVQINPSTMSSKSWATFQNDSLPSAWIVFNVTNLRDVLRTGTIVPNVVPIRVSTAKWVPKYNITFSTDGKLVSYHEPHFFEAVDDAPALLDQYVTVVNPVYLGAMAQVNRQLQAAAGPGAIVKGQVDDIDEVTFYNAALSASMLPPFNAQLLSASSTLIAALRFFSVPVYMQSCFTVLNVTAGLSQSRVVALWTRNDNSTTLPAPCNGMILPLQLDLAKGAALLSTATANSLTGRAGLLTWMNALSLQTPAAIAPLLVNGFTMLDFQNVAQWLATLMPTEGFRSVAIDIGFRTTLGALVPAGSTFNDLGFLQFGSGSIVTVLTAGASSSVVDVIGPSVGYLASVNLPKPAEIRVGAIDYCSRAEYSSLVICRFMTAATAPYMTIAQTRDFFTFASGQTANVVTLSRVLAAWFSAANASSATMAQLFVPFNASASPTVRAIISRPFFGTNGANADLLCAYINAYVPHVFTGYLSELNEFGVTPANSGLFVRLTLREALFGVNNAGATKTTAIAQWSPILDGPQVPAANKSWDQLAYEYMAANVGRTSTIYTCQDTRDNCGKVVTYFGSPGFLQSCQINDPASLNECAATSSSLAYNNYTLWNGYEQIDGTNTIFATPPLKSDKDALQIATIYVNDVRRTVQLPLNGEKPKVKGVETRRYQVDSRYFFTNIDGYNATTNPMRDTYRYMTADAPDGFVHTFAARGGMPLAVCLPRFNLVGSEESSKLTGFTSDPLEDITFLDVEPISGKSFRGARRLQANMLLRKKNFNALNALHANLFKAIGGSHVYMPYYYMDETKIVSDDDASDFKNQVIFAIDLSRALQIAFLVIGCVCFVLSAASLHVVRKRANAAADAAAWGGAGKALKSNSAMELQAVPASTV